MGQVGTAFAAATPPRVSTPGGPAREIMNALLYLSRTGCQWRLLPHDLPPWEKVYTICVNCPLVHVGAALAIGAAEGHRAQWR